MVVRDDFDIFCDNNNIEFTTISGKFHEWVMIFPNGDIKKYIIEHISQIDELYNFREILYEDAQVKMRQIKLKKVTQYI